jgi:replicative DNA helicase
MIYDLALKRDLIGIGEEVVNTAYEHNVDVDAAQQIEAAEQKLFHLASEGDGEGGFKPLKHSLSQAILRTESAYKNSGKVVGVSTGLADLDKLLGGFQRSELLILAGRPSMGKTALATSIAFNASKFFAEQAGNDPLNKDQKSVGFFSLEMSGEQLSNRLLSSATNINSAKLLRGDISNDDFAHLVRASHELSRLKFHIDDTPALSIAALRTRARRLKRTQNLGLLVVDYLQLVRASSTIAHNNRVLEVSEITQGLKAIAKELDIPVLALSQLSRAVEQREDKRPQLADLRESGSIEQDADVVMFVFREEYYMMRKQPREDTPEHQAWQEEMEKIHGIAEVIVAKQRNGPIDNVKLQFEGALTRFSDLAQPEFMPEQRY